MRDYIVVLPLATRRGDNTYGLSELRSCRRPMCGGPHNHQERRSAISQVVHRLIEENATSRSEYLISTCKCVEKANILTLGRGYNNTGLTITPTFRYLLGTFSVSGQNVASMSLLLLMEMLDPQASTRQMVELQKEKRLVSNAMCF